MILNYDINKFSFFYIHFLIIYGLFECEEVFYCYTDKRKKITHYLEW